jgi:predicted transcriptional regulator of viral defense system
MRSAADFVDDLQVNGRLTFTTEDVVAALERSGPAVRAQLRRLRDKGQVIDPVRSFWVVVPPRYRRLGCLPAAELVPALMGHLGEPWYVTLLSAAAFHGAAHQAPMAFQVMLPSARRSFACGDVRVDFVRRHDMTETPVVQHNVPTGILQVASPEATALELVGYPERCGYLDNVATVLAELADVMDGALLAREALRAPVAWAQRLGFLLTTLDRQDLAEPVAAALAERTLFAVPLAPWLPSTGASRDSRWHVAINTKVEVDL